MKRHLIACHRAALAAGFPDYAASLAALYLREYGRPIPSPEAARVAEYLNSKPPFPVPAAAQFAPHDL